MLRLQAATTIRSLNWSWQLIVVESSGFGQRTKGSWGKYSFRHRSTASASWTLKATYLSRICREFQKSIFKLTEQGLSITTVLRIHVSIQTFKTELQMNPTYSVTMRKYWLRMCHLGEFWSIQIKRSIRLAVGSSHQAHRKSKRTTRCLRWREWSLYQFLNHTMTKACKSLSPNPS